MSNLRPPLAGLRRSAHRRLVVAYATVMVVTAAALWTGSAWVDQSLELQAASESSAASTSAELSSANQILGYAVDISSAPSDALPVQLVVQLQQSVQRCDDAWQEAKRAATAIRLDQIDAASLARLTVQVDASHDDMSQTAGQVLADTQSADPARRALVGAAVTRLAAKMGSYVDAARAQATFFSDLSKSAVVRARLRVVAIACAIIGMVVFVFIAIIAPLHRRSAVLIESTARSQEQDRRLGADIARHVAERDRNEAEAQFKALFQQSSVGVVLCELDGRILESNAALQGMLGFTPDELRGMPFGALAGAAHDRAADFEDGAELFLGQFRAWGQPLIDHGVEDAAVDRRDAIARTAAGFLARHRGRF